MAALDPTQFEPFYKLFPELTRVETYTVILYSAALPFKDIARLKGGSAGTQKNLIANAREKLAVNTSSELKTAVQIRLLLCAMAHGVCPQGMKGDTLKHQ
jgi:DNA-binding CsgD family transcriptional regulator